MREDISEKNKRKSAARKRRRQNSERLSILILAIFIIAPYIWCAILLVKVQSLNDALQSVTGQLEEMNSLFLEQQELLEVIIEEMDTLGEGIVLENEVEHGAAQENYAVEGENPTEQVDILEKEAAHKVYLTFDDGPSTYTDDILDILDQYNVKATFFVVGKEDNASKEALKEIVERGHSLGMHSYSHKYQGIYESVDSFAEDFQQIQNYLYNVTGVKSTIYRFPGGSSNQVSDLDMQEFADYLQTCNVKYYDWNVSSGDGTSVERSVQELVDNCTRDIETRETSIILLHDAADKRTTVEALPTIIENILALEDTVILPITEETEPVQHNLSALDTKVKE